MDAVVDATSRPDRRRATDVLGVAAAMLTAVGVLSYVVRGAASEELFASWVIHNAPIGFAGSLVMAAALRRQPANRAARFLFAASLLSAVHVAVYAIANAVAAADPSIPAGPVFAGATDIGALPPLVGTLVWIASTIWVPAGALFMLYGMPLLPDGRWPGPRWRLVERVAVVPVVAFTAAWSLFTWPGRDTVVNQGDLPHGTPLIEVLFWIGAVGWAACTAVAVSAVVVKLRRASSQERRRMRPVGAMTLATLVVMVVLYPWQPLWALASAGALCGLLVVIAVAMTRHHLFDVEVLVSRAVTAAVLAAFVTLAYVGIVVGVGYLLGDRDNLILALAATAAIAVAFEPLRRRVASWARRLVLGARATPGEVLGQLSDGLAGSASTEDVLVHVAELLVAGTGATRAEVRSDGLLLAAAGRGADGWRTAGRGRAGRASGPDRATRTADVRGDGHRLGQVTIMADRDDLLLPDDEELLARVAALLGPVLRNAALASELQQTVDELRASRQRLVLAEETVRRSVERDIHDGAQQQLLGVRLKLGLASALAGGGEVDRLLRVVHEAAEETEAAIRGLRQLARGLHPPVLEQEGLVAALRSHLRQVPLGATVDAPADLPRFAAELEVALYLCCLEAVQNVTKHAAATTVVVRLRHRMDVLSVDVVDDGCGVAEAGHGVGLHSIRDRVEALGGTFVLDSTPAQGTRVRLRVPAVARPPSEPDPASDARQARWSEPSEESPVSAR